MAGTIVNLFARRSAPMLGIGPGMWESWCGFKMRQWACGCIATVAP